MTSYISVALPRNDASVANCCLECQLLLKQFVLILKQFVLILKQFRLSLKQFVLLLKQFVLLLKQFRHANSALSS